jgi:hypothetical protein
MCTAPNIITVIKSRRTRWAGNAVRMEEMKNAYGILVGRPEEKKRHKILEYMKEEH